MHKDKSRWHIDKWRQRQCRTNDDNSRCGHGNDLSLAPKPNAICKFVLYLHWRQLNGSDVGGVYHGLGPVGSVGQQALPLLWQSGELLLPWIEACVDPVLKVRRSGDFQPFLLLSKHAGKPWQTWQPKGKACLHCSEIRLDNIRKIIYLEPLWLDSFKATWSYLKIK